MTITRVQGNAQGVYSGGDAIAYSMNSNPASGNVLVACISITDLTDYNTVSSISQSNVSWSLAAQSNSNGVDAEIWVGSVSAGASKSVTVNFTDNGSDSGAYLCAVVDICEYSGLSSATADKTATDSGSSGSLSTGTTGTTSQATELWIGCGAGQYGQSSASNGFSLLDGGVEYGGEGGYSSSCAYLEKIVSSTGGASTGTSITSGYQWAGCIATFKASITYYTITSSADSHSTISPSGSVQVAQGNNQTFSYSANTGYYISQVLVDGSAQSITGSYTFNNVQANHTIAVSSHVIVYTITTSPDSNSSMSPSNPQVNYGSNQTITISANTGYHITHVYVDTVDQGVISSYTFSNVTANHTISCTSTINTYTITTSPDAHSSLSPSNPVVNYDSNQTITISANTGYHITGVTVDGNSQGVISSFPFNSVTGNHTISCTSAINTYAITASADANSTISPAGITYVNYGSDQSYTMSANTGFQITHVYVDGVDQGAITTYTFTNVTGIHTIYASTSTGSNSLEVTGNLTVDANSTVINSLSANSISTVGNVTIGGSAAVTNQLSSSTFSTTGNATIGGNAVVTGTLTVQGQPVNCQTASLPLQLSNGVLSIQQATGSTNGYLSSSDWNTFNGKYGSGSNATLTGLTVTGAANVGSLQIGGTQVLSSSGQLQNLTADASLITSGTIVSARLPTTLQMSGSPTFAGLTVNGPMSTAKNVLDDGSGNMITTGSLTLPCICPYFTWAQLEPYLWQLQYINGSWQWTAMNNTLPLGTSFIHFVDNDNGTVNWLDVGIIRDEMAPTNCALWVSQHLIVKKDFSCGGAVYSLQGALLLGSDYDATNTNGQMPQIILANSELDPQNDFIFRNTLQIWRSGYLGFGNLEINNLYVHGSISGSNGQLVVVGSPLNIVGSFSSSATGYGYLTAVGTYGYLSGSTGTVNVSLQTSYRIFCGGEIDVYSDQRDKTLIDALSAQTALSAIMKLNPLHFAWKPETQKGNNVVAGFFAQEVAKAIPEAVIVHEGARYTDEYNLNYDVLTTYALSAIQCLTKEVEALRSEMKRLSKVGAS